MLEQEIHSLLLRLPCNFHQEVQLLFDQFLSKLSTQASIISAQTAQLEAQAARIQELENRLSKNSQNSSKPPSSDAPYDKPEPKSQRPKTGRRSGGQKGHKGKTLEKVANPDHIERHKVTMCEHCQKDLSAVDVHKLHSRQVYDIPPIKVRVTEHQVEEKKCSCGHCTRAEFPADVTHYVQYGKRLKGGLLYFQDYQLLPYGRCCEVVTDLFGHNISPGTLYNIRKTAFNRLESFEEALKLALTVAVVAGFDETGFRVLKNCYWLHSCSTNKHAYYQVHKKRGSEAMDYIGILPKFKGIAVHDFWQSYLTYEATHSLCNAHLLRELTFLEERHKQKWAKDLAKVLTNMKKAKDKALKKGKTALSKATIRKYERQYDEIVLQGLESNPFVPPKKKKKGRVAKTKARNLLERLQKYKKDILRFFNNFKVPFDNNFSERDIRMMKLKQKISGCFRSIKGAQFFARIRSYIMTARKQNINCLEAIIDLFANNKTWNKLI